MENVTPVLMCKSPGESRTFYEAAGFSITYWQDTPYFYGAIQRGEISLHLTKGKSGAMCLVHVPDVAVYHRAIADGLRATYGRIPVAGFPRITRLRPGQTRFHLFDPTGNDLVFINMDEPDIDYDAYDDTLSPLMRALDTAAFLRDTYTDDKGAAKLLDKKLARHTDATPLERARVLASRAELAVALGEIEHSRALRHELEQIPLSDEDREQFHDELHAADYLERWIVQADADPQPATESADPPQS